MTAVAEKTALPQLPALQRDGRSCTQQAESTKFEASSPRGTAEVENTEDPDGSLSEKATASQQATREGGPAGPTRVIDAQHQREPTLLAVAGDWHRAEDRHLVLLAVFRQLKGIWEKLMDEKEEDMRQLLIVVTFAGTERLPSARRRNPRFPLEPTCCC